MFSCFVNVLRIMISLILASLVLNIHGAIIERIYIGFLLGLIELMLTLIGFHYLVNPLLCILIGLSQDHYPIVLDVVSSYSSGLNRFRFQNFWIQYPQVAKIVDHFWNLNISSKNMLIYIPKVLAILRNKISFWNKYYVGDLESSLSKVNAYINELEPKEDLTPLNDSEVIFLTSLYNKSKAIRRQINLKWWAMSKEK
ncbi:hypothetical protein Cni_G26547 [Canna indica]|uniref:Uncharacterized protein n=1 Tax=Canna indica TaxID=4628 RepID=A0AAQ3KZZ1_9LILI|nr:hypothetical protein Cni_G26547 [Canna indica]